MVPTDPADGPTGLVNDALGTLPPEEESYGVEDQLLRRKLKRQMFAAASVPPVKIGRYDVLEGIGRGAMGNVYAAVDGELDRKIAIKLLRAGRPGGRERMLREARALAKLSHPNVVTVHEVGTHGERVFVAMEFIAGNTLRAWLGQPRTREEVREVLGQAARGLHAAHQAGLVHRDFKPDNVIIGQDGRVRVVDFGLAKPSQPAEPVALVETPNDANGGAEAATDLTRTGQLVGTPAYMAAEQFLGEAVDARTDVFAFSVTLYECLANTRPFAGTNTAELAKSVLDEQVRALEGEGALPKLVHAGLSRDRERRPASMLPFIEALAAGTSSRPARRGARRWVFSAAALAVVAGGTVALRESDATSTAQPSPPRVQATAAASAGVKDPADDRAAEAMATLLEAPDEAARVEHAKAYLESFADTGGDARRAIAESTLGESLWRASCDRPTAGLCIDLQAKPTADAYPHCDGTRRGPIAQRPRDPALSADALAHLQIVAELAHATPPEREAERDAWAGATRLAHVRIADAELEPLLALAVPPDLDFQDETAALSSAAVRMFLTRVTRDAQRLLKGYKRAKGHSAELDVLAAFRTGLVFEAGSEPFALAPIPATLVDDAEKRAAYCDALDAVIEPPRQAAQKVYAWCDTRAAEGGVDSEAAQRCRNALGR